MSPINSSMNSRRGGGGGGQGRGGNETSSVPLYLWRDLLLVAVMLLFGLSGFSMIGRITNNYAEGGWGLLNNNAPNSPVSKSPRSTNRTNVELRQKKYNLSVVLDNAIIEQQQPSADGMSTDEEVPSETEVTGDGGSSFVVQREYLQHLRSLDPFPMKLQIIFPQKDFYKRRDVDFVKNGILRFMELNPTWNVTVYDDSDMDGIIGMAADDGIISMDEKNALVGNDTQPAAHPVERSDLARLLIIWYYGGIYVDVDALVNPRDFSAVFGTTHKMCLPTNVEINFHHAIICSSPKNRLHIDIINQMSEKRMTSNGGGPIERRGGWASTRALFSMGPPLFNHVIFATVFGKNVSGYGVRDHGGIPGMRHCRYAILEQAGDLIVTGKFKDYCDSFIAAPFEGCVQWDRTEFYNTFNMSRWRKAVNMRWNATKS